MRKLALALALVAVSAGCSHKRPRPPPPAPLPVELPKISFDGAKFDELQFTQAQLTFHARVENPNPFPLSVSRVRFGIEIEGRTAAKGEVDAAFAIPAMAPDLVPGRGGISFPVALRFAAIPGFTKVMATKQEAAYALTGAVAFRTPHGVVEVPIQGGGVLAIPELPKVDVKKFVLKSASAREVVLELGLRVKNPNGFPLPAAGVDYALIINKKEVTRARGRIAEPLGAGESTELSIPITISVLKVGQVAARFLLPFASIKAELRGGFDFGGFPIPLDLDADVLPK